MDSIILGCGITGILSAYYLAKAGHKVTVIEKNRSVGMGCSYANGGQLSYSHIETWAERDSMLSLLKAALLPNSFFYPTKILDPHFVRWAYKFCKNSSKLNSQNNGQEIYKLTNLSKINLNKILREENIDPAQFQYSTTGILHFYRNQKRFDNAILKLENDLSHRNFEILNPLESVELEPCLSRLLDNKKLAGSILYKDDASGNAKAFCEIIAKICQEKYKVNFIFDAEIKNIFTNYKKITGINTSKGVFTGDAYIYCLGAEGNKMLRGINFDSEIYPLKGYSLSIPTNSNFIAPKIAMTDPENRMVYSRLGDDFRAAGLVEINQLSNRINQKSIAFMKSVISKSFSEFGDISKAKAWTGLRPFRPNSLPLTCRVEKYQNLFINSGHGSLGWTTAVASGQILQEIVHPI